MGATPNALGLEVNKQLVESVERPVLILQDRFGDAAAAKTLVRCMLHRILLHGVCLALLSVVC